MDKRPVKQKLIDLYLSYSQYLMLASTKTPHCSTQWLQTKLIIVYCSAAQGRPFDYFFTVLEIIYVVLREMYGYGFIKRFGINVARWVHTLQQLWLQSDKRLDQELHRKREIRNTEAEQQRVSLQEGWRRMDQMAWPSDQQPELPEWLGLPQIKHVM